MTASTKKMAQASLAFRECLPPQLFRLKPEAYLYQDEEFKNQKQLNDLKFISV